MLPHSWITRALVFLAPLLWVAKPAQAIDAAPQFADLGRCPLTSGQVIEHCRIGYRTFGKLNATRDNAVLMPTWLYGKSSDLVSLFGEGSAPGELVDTSHFYGIAIDALGNGISSSPSNSQTQHGTAFPAFTPQDTVETEYRVVTEVLGLHHLHAVLGLSMGGELTFVWSVTHPEFFDLAVPILGTPRLTSYDLQVKRVQVETILSDPAYQDGNYTTEPPLKLANLFGNLVVTTPEYRNEITPRQAGRIFRHGGVSAVHRRQRPAMASARHHDPGPHRKPHYCRGRAIDQSEVLDHRERAGPPGQSAAGVGLGRSRGCTGVYLPGQLRPSDHDLRRRCGIEPGTTVSAAAPAIRRIRGLAIPRRHYHCSTPHHRPHPSARTRVLIERGTLRPH
jgi:pimeloyl-ACP methyl ester carboxylesterase